MFLNHSNCPAEVGERDPLRRAAAHLVQKTLLDVIARLGKQPLTQVLQDFLDLNYGNTDLSHRDGSLNALIVRERRSTEFAVLQNLVLVLEPLAILFLIE